MDDNHTSHMPCTRGRLSDEKSYIIKPTAPSAIIKLQDPNIIEHLLEQPLSEVTTSLIASGNGFYAAAGCPLAQTAFKRRVFQHFAQVQS
jgi:hypothetical protein